MIDVVDIADRADSDVVVNRGAVSQFDPYAPFACRCAEQSDLTRLLVVNDEGVGIRDHLHLRRRAGAHIIDYVSLARIQRESHYRGRVRVIRRKGESLPQHDHADSSHQPRKQSTSSFCFHLLHLASSRLTVCLSF